MGCQCVPNCVIAGLYNSIVSVSRWTSDSLDNILQQGDKLYNSIKKTHNLLQVNDIGPQINAFQNTYNFHIVLEFFGRIGKHQLDNDIGSTLENATFSVIQQKKNKELILCILCVGNEKGASASLLFISQEHCYIFGPHSRNSYGLPVDSVTSILASFKSKKI